MFPHLKTGRVSRVVYMRVTFPNKPISHKCKYNYFYIILLMS